MGDGAAVFRGGVCVGGIHRPRASAVDWALVRQVTLTLTFTLTLNPNPKPDPDSNPNPEPNPNLQPGTLTFNPEP